MRAEIPNVWVLGARRLKRGGDIVFDAYEADLSAMERGSSPLELDNLEIAGVATLLYGLSIENLLKAIIIHKNPNPVENDKLREWDGTGHDLIKLAKKAGFYTCYVTNGYINEDPLRELSAYLDAMNIDIKAFNDDFYRKVCKSHLEPVLNTCELAKELDIHIELTYLVIPGYNDSLDEVREFCKWIVEKLDDNTPVHFSRFHPDHNMTNVERTPMETLLKIFEVAKKVGILFPFLGNVYPGEYENTYCPKCGNICIERKGYTINFDGFHNGRCRKCGKDLPIIMNKYKK